MFYYYFDSITHTSYTVIYPIHIHNFWHFWLQRGVVTHQQVEARTPNNDALVVLGHNNNNGGGLYHGALRALLGNFRERSAAKTFLEIQRLDCNTQISNRT